jgi:hypothetical protein
MFKALAVASWLTSKLCVARKLYAFTRAPGSSRVHVMVAVVHLVSNATRSRRVMKANIIRACIPSQKINLQ